MCEEAYQANEDALTIVLRELDTSMAQLRAKQVELSDAARSAHVGCSPDTLRSFESRRLAMSKAADRYRVALGAFHVVCQKYRRPIVYTSEPNVAKRGRARGAVRVNWDQRKQRLSLRKEALQFSKSSLIAGVRKESLQDKESLED
jgi:hypothetical protein